MGNINTLFSTNPTEILPVEAYLADAQCFAIENLGSTRFMKVAKGKNSIDTYVYKVFVRQDNASLDPFPTKVKTIWETLSKAPNCSPIKLLVVKAKYAVLMRWYQKYTLSDRMSTRPFLGPSEKVWYIYQILKALEQCHREGVCHGDLKSQNVLVTSSNWCLITDFAPFKPSFLPLENPSSYTYFFDTSRRQTCYIAPERLLKTEEYDKNCENKDWLFGSLDPKMDMFSAGCVIYELLCDGKSPFTYSQLCQYKTVSKREAADILDRLVLDVPSMYRPLLKQLLLIEPQYRLTAEEALNGTAIIFPKIITEFLFDYMTSFLPVYGSSNARDFSQPLECSYRESDPVIQMLKQGKSAWMAKLQENSESKSFAVIFVSLITANVRCLKSSRVKVDAMNMLVELSKLCESHVAIDRILPYLVYSFTECEPQVQAAAIFSITDMLESTTPTTLEESLVFTDYLFPELTHLMETADLSQPLQFAIASCLGALAETAISYLTVGVGIQQNTDDDDFSVAETIPDSQKMTEKTALIQKFVHNIFTSLFGKFAIVRHCLVKKENLKRLTAFFYKCGNGDEVMSQLMTFLNEKKDWQMRAALFDSLPICAQRHNVGMEELLVQGLQDTEEFVVIRTIQCIAVLAANSILNKNTIKEKLLAEVIPFLAHPNEWIRSAVCDFLVTIDGKWNIADVHVTLKPLVEPYLQPGRVLYRLNSKLVLSDYLAQPLPRDVWTRVMHLNHLNTRKLVQLLDNHMRRGDPFISNEDWFKKIFAHSELGVTVRSDMNPDSPIKPSTKEDRENERSRIVKQLYAFRNLLPKMAVLRTSGVEPHRSRNEGRVELSTFVPKEKFRKFAFNQPAKEPDMQINTNSYVNDKFDEDQETEDGGTQAEEFRKISVPHSNQIKTSVFEMNVFKLLDHLSLVRERGVVPKRSNLQNASSVHRRGGVLITHLHEHSDTVNKLALTKNGKTLASASKDGTIRLWKSRTIAGEGSGEARSHLAFNPTGGSSEVFSVGWYQDCVVATTRDGQITWTNVETDRKQVTRLTIPSDEGPPLCAQTFGPLTFVRTHHGVFYGLDTRVGRTYGPLGRHETWRKKVESCEGMVLCNAVDPFQQAWMAIGTMAQSENIIIWDLRFQIEAMRLKNPPKLRPNGIYVDPSKPSEPQLYVAYDYQGDVSAYKLCEAERQRHTVLWTGTEPLVYPTVKFNDPERETNRVNALCVCESSGLVYTGDRMGALRLWDTQRVDKSRAISMPQKVPGRYIFVHREKRSEAPDQPRVIYETAYLNSENTKIKIAPLEARPSTNHRSGITDMLLMNDGLMATSSVDGIIKIWK